MLSFEVRLLPPADFPFMFEETAVVSAEDNHFALQMKVIDRLSDEDKRLCAVSLFLAKRKDDGKVKPNKWMKSLLQKIVYHSKMLVVKEIRVSIKLRFQPNLIDCVENGHHYQMSRISKYPLND